MEPYYYAQLNQDDICFAISALSGEVEGEYMIPIDSYNDSLLGKRYKNGEWTEVEPKEMSEVLSFFEPENIEIAKLINELRVELKEIREEVKVASRNKAAVREKKQEGS